MARLFARSRGRACGDAALCRPHRLFPRRAEVPVSRRAGAAGPDRAAASGISDLGRRTTLFPGRHRRQAARDSLHKELTLIAKLNYAHYFLTVHDIVHYARSQNILCQGRGSAANSAVCFMLGVTAVNPQEIDLLFERFLSEERLRAAGHRRRFRARPARGGDAVCLSPLRPAARGDHRHRHSLSAAQRHPRRRQGAGPDRGHHRRAGRHRVGKLGRRLHRQQLTQAGLDPDNPMIGRALAACDRADRISAPPVAACRRLRADPGPARHLCADRQCGDGSPHLHRVGQGRRRRGAHDEGRRAGARHADLHPQMF